MIFSLSDTAHARFLPSQEEMRRFDQGTIAAGTPSIELMERAGVEVFRELKERFSFDLYSNGRVAVLAGPGNNGGDGLVIARHLKDHGYEVVVVLASSERYSADLLDQIAQFRKKDGAVFQFPQVSPAEGEPLETLSDADLHTILTGASVVVDALLGTGQTAAPRGAIASLLQAVIRSRKDNPDAARLVAVDMPTGINGDTGEVYEGAIAADLTVAIELIKRGMLQYPAREFCGDIWVVKIGLACDRAAYSLLDRTTVRALKARNADAHKGDFGSVLVIGGSQDMPGAPCLSAMAAIRCGVGAVTKAHLRCSMAPGLPPEIMLANVGENERFFIESHLAELRGRIEKASALILGPGLGTDAATVAFVGAAIGFAGEKGRPLIIDADALNCMALLREQKNMPACAGAILTPHPGEMARLLGISTAEVQRNRYAAASELSRITQATVVLKGAATIVSSPDRGWVNTSGNSWLAVAGSGDILCGAIAAFLAQGFTAAEAACAGVLLHGRAGDLLEQQGAVPFIASDLTYALARLIGEEMRGA